MSVFSEKGGTNANGPQRSYVQQPNGNMLTGYQGGASFGSPGMTNMLTGFGGAQQSPGISGLYGGQQQTAPSPAAPAVMPPSNPELSGLPFEQPSPQISGLPFQPPSPEVSGLPYERPRSLLGQPVQSPNPQISGLPVQPMPSGNTLTGGILGPGDGSGAQGRAKAARGQFDLMNMGFMR